ncbi:MAG TPA: hypothetical protein DCS80_04005 [Betaproteobacteria bacterium]|jgi:hypothetical protein|nr:hypothetical protein [Betaproteobacteria bacterium]
MSGLERTLTVWSMANITSLLGTLGIVGSLIFVGFEIQQNQNIAMASQLQARNAALMAFYSAPLEGSSIALRLMEGGIEPDIDWSNDEERATLIAIVRVRIISLLNSFNQYNAGLIDESTYTYTMNRALQIYENCKLRPTVVQRVPERFLDYLEINSTVNC